MLSYPLRIHDVESIRSYQDAGLIDPGRDPEDVWRELHGEGRRDPETQLERDREAIMAVFRSTSL